MRDTRPYQSDIIAAIRDASPIIVAYFPIAMTFGVIATSQGISRLLTCFISFAVYAGSAQFMMVSLFAASVSISPLSFIITILLVNLRHVLYGTALGPRTQRWTERHRLAAAFGLTDEVFAVTSARGVQYEPAATHHILFTLACYLSWVAGTVCGASIGSIVPAAIANVLSFALPSLFLALLFMGTVTIPYLVAAGSGIGIAVFLTSSGLGNLAIIAAAVIGASIGFAIHKSFPRFGRSKIP